MVCFHTKPAKKSAIKLHYLFLKKEEKGERKSLLSQVFLSLSLPLSLSLSLSLSWDMEREKTYFTWIADFSQIKFRFP